MAQWPPGDGRQPHRPTLHLRSEIDITRPTGTEPGTPGVLGVLKPLKPLRNGRDTTLCLRGSKRGTLTFQNRLPASGVSDSRCPVANFQCAVSRACSSVPSRVSRL